MYKSAKNTYMNSKRFAIISLLVIWFGLLLTFRCEKEVLKVKDDTEAPVLETEPTVTRITYNSFVISWITDEPCMAKVFYGIESGTDTLQATEQEYRQQHSVLVDSLGHYQKYFFYTASIDVAGNISYSSSLTFSTGGDTSRFIAFGWEAFEAHNYSKAKLYFSDYLMANPNDIDALTGYGWSLLGVDSIRNAIDQFITVLEENDRYLDALSGLALANYIDDDPFSCVDHCVSLIALDSLYCFEHDTTYSVRNCFRLILLDSYVEALMTDNAVDYLNRYFNEYYTINPEDTVWTVGDTTYTEIGDALRHIVANIKALFWKNNELPIQILSAALLPKRIYYSYEDIKKTS